MKALYLKELRSFLGSIIGYIFIGIFFVTNALFLWIFVGNNNVFDGGTADLNGFFLLGPMIFFVLVPAITMRSFSEEKRTGTIELLYTRPISDFAIIFSKYLAGVTLVFISLLPTLIYLWCIHDLGETMSAGSAISVVDDAAFTTSYLGLFLVGACFVAIGIFASAASNSQIVAFILAMFSCWFLFFGFDLAANYSQFGGLDSFLRNLGFQEHYYSIQKGVMDIRDVIYFLSVIALFLMLTHLRLGSRKKDIAISIMDSRASVWQIRGLILGLFLVNYIASYFVFRIDFTEDKRHSLSPHTIDMLEDNNRIKDRVFFKIYLEGDLPADIQKIRNSIQEKLDEFIIYSGDKIQYDFIDPNSDEDADYNLEVQKTIYQEGIRPCDIEIINSGTAEVKTIWPGALVEYKGMTVDQVQFFNKRIIRNNEDLHGLAERTINNLEYKLISAVRRVTADGKQTIGFLNGHGELNEWQTADVRTNLRRYYLVKDVEINGQIAALDEVDALVVAQPTERFTEKDKFVIDQFIMHGGRVMWFVDPLEINRDSLYYTGQTFGISKDLNLSDQLFKYGVRLNNDVVIDKECGPLFVPGHPLEVVDWFFYPLLEREDLDGKTHAITKNIDPIKSEYPASMKIVNEGDAAVKKTVLLKSSYNSQIFRAPARINYGIINVEPNFNDGSELAGDYPVAVLLEGQFSSPFENRISDVFLQSEDYETKFFSDSTKMIVVSDGDVIRNEVDSALFEGRMNYRAMPLNFDVFEVTNQNGTRKYIYGNREFVLNSIDYLLDDYSLLDIRTKTITLRLLDSEKVKENRSFWKIVNIAVPLGLLLILAITQFMIRRRRYAT
ncbi:gliding motility-associated ABC transporter substrate-binding protein GldG [Crocinitomix catalasitica]|nr:gliding motility-associated ABC transporter substrate-binding protein GldG [Crocinitomix catalasitica]